jgi:3-oxoacyl-[acyl-carrier protein] reductase
MIDLTGKTALVTGASRGLGRAEAQCLAQAGAHVLVHYKSGAADAEAAAAEIRQMGGSAQIIAADLAEPDGPRALAAQVRAIVGDRLDVLVCNAGVAKEVTLEDTTVQDFDQLYAVNLRAPFFLVQQLLPVLGTGSSVILTSSLAARATLDMLAAYAATKGGIEALVRHLAIALGTRGIRVNAIAPGAIDTDMANFAKTEAGRTYAFNMQALKRIGKPEDIGPVVAFLASDAARWITGEILQIDGGSKL